MAKAMTVLEQKEIMMQVIKLIRDKGITTYNDLIDYLVDEEMTEAFYVASREITFLKTYLRDFAAKKQNEDSTDPKKALLEEFLSKPIPINYYDLDKNDRDLIIRDEECNRALWDASSSRTHVCIREVVDYCYVPSGLEAPNAFVIGKWMRELGWEPESPKTLDPLYGKQRNYIKKR